MIDNILKIDFKSLKIEALKKACVCFGSQRKLALFLGYTQSAISAWMIGRNSIPLPLAFKIEKHLNGQITHKELRPDLFEILE